MISYNLSYLLEHSINLIRLFMWIRYENVNLSRHSISPNKTRDGNSGVTFLWMD